MKMICNRMLRKHLPIILILLASFYLLFNNLGNQFLWQDEAETAVLARNTLEYGFPRAYDGKNLVNPTIRTGYGPDHGWRYHPWGQFYITALSFRIFGEGTFRARLPFALFGLINILLVYLFTLRTTENRNTAAIAAFLTGLSVPFLLLMRQCRYYAPAVFLILTILLLYHWFLKRKTVFILLPLAATLALLGHTVHGMYVPVTAALAAHYILFSADRKTWPWFFACCLGSFLLVLPWFIYSNSSAHVASITAERIWKNLEFQIRMINKYIIPAAFLLSMYPLRGMLTKRWTIHLRAGEKQALKLITPVIVLSILAFCFAQERNFRYLVYFIPLLAIVEAMILIRLMRFNRVLFTAFLLISIFTNFFNMFRPEPLLPRYLYEITHDYDGPIEGIVRFFWARSDRIKKGETIKISYGDMPLMFYTDFRVDNSGVYDKEHMPEWIVFRRWWDGKESLTGEYFLEVQKEYKKHVLNYPDIPWENRPGDIDYHGFSTDTEAPGVIIFEKK
ncbi:MAG: hypothetical protein GF392_00615 [Candidatus Omnitrophica bacterium]|nr:hypothetical protein [Candidatus Omnitrophota bacterium]